MQYPLSSSSIERDRKDKKPEESNKGATSLPLNSIASLMKA